MEILKPATDKNAKEADAKKKQKYKKDETPTFFISVQTSESEPEEVDSEDTGGRMRANVRWM